MPAPASAPRSRIFAILFVTLAVLIVALALLNYVVMPRFITKMITEAPQPPAVVAAQAARLETRTDATQAIGTIEAVNGVSVSAEVGGTIRSFSFQSGDFATKGQILARLDAETQEAAVILAQASLRNAQQELDRVKPLTLTQTLSKAALDRAVAARDEARARLAGAQADLDKRLIRAPFSGRMGIRAIDLGQYIAPGQILVSLQSIDPIFVSFSMPENNLSHLARGQQVRVSVDARPGETFLGTITSLDSSVDRATRNIRVQATLPNPNGALTPGQFAQVSVTSANAQNMVTVPETAVAYSLYGEEAFKLIRAPDGETWQAPNADKSLPVYIAKRISVAVGNTLQGRISLAGTSVKSGDLIVTAGQNKLRDGARAVISTTLQLSDRPLPRE